MPGAVRPAPNALGRRRRPRYVSRPVFSYLEARARELTYGRKSPGPPLPTTGETLKVRLMRSALDSILLLENNVPTSQLIVWVLIDENLRGMRVWENENGLKN